MTFPAPAGKVDLSAGDLLACPDGRVYRATDSPDGGLTVEPLLTAAETRAVLAIFTGAHAAGGGGGGPGAAAAAVRDGGRGAGDAGR